MKFSKTTIQQFPGNRTVLACVHLLCIACLALLGLSASLHAQVHYHDNGQPWTQRAASGPDAEVPGWFYNLGITGLRAQLVADEPKALLVKYMSQINPKAKESHPHTYPKGPAFLHRPDGGRRLALLRRLFGLGRRPNQFL